MDNDFSITILNKGQEKEYKGRLLQQGYSYKIIVLVDEMEVYFEPDEERNFRVVRMPGQDEKQLDKIDKGLLQALAAKLEAILQ